MEYNVVTDDVPEGMSALEIASAGQRLGAWLVDAVIGTLVGVVGFVIGISISAGGHLLVLPVAIAYIVVYFWLVSTRGQSPGKLALGIKIVKADGGSLGLGGALLREIIGKFISSLIIYLGYIWILFDDKRQGWHDKIASTYVVKV